MPEGPVKDTDYDITYENNTNAGTATATVTFKGNYSGEKKLSFIINQKSIDSATITTEGLTYNGSEQTAKITKVTLSDNTELAESDYKVSGNTGKNAATYNALTIKGTGNYNGTATGSFTIATKTVSIAWEPEGDAIFYYDGETHTPTATIEGVAEGEGLTATLKYTDREKTSLDPDSAPSALGSYIVTVTGLTAAAGTTVSNYVLPEEGLTKNFDIVLGKYWLAFAGAANPEDTSVVVKSQGQIDEDMAVLHGTDEETKGIVVAEYTNYMNGKNATGGSQEVRLYTKWYGATTDSSSTEQDANKYVEMRIIQVGAHDEDGSAVTFMATHALPTAQQMNTSNNTNAGSWEDSYMRTTVMSDYVSAGMKDIASAALPLNKVTTSGNSGSWTQDSTTADTFWLLSNSELFGAGENNTFISGNSPSFYVEGTQYAWFTTQNVNAKNGYSTNNQAIATLFKTRSGFKPVNSAGGSVSTWSLRSPVVSTGYSFGGVGNSDNPYYPSGTPTTMDNAINARGVVPAFAL